MGAYGEVMRDARLIGFLAALDEDLARQRRSRACGRCGGQLHFARYARKPRGLDVPAGAERRHGLCCARCRRRVLPPSVLFFDRRVYVGVVVLVVVSLRQQRIDGYGARRLMALFGVSPRTLRRWMSWFAEHFLASTRWRVHRGVVPASVRDEDVPGALVLPLFERADPVAALGQWVAHLLGPDPPQTSR